MLGIPKDRLRLLGFTGDPPIDASETVLVRIHPGGLMFTDDGAAYSLLADGLVVLTPLGTGPLRWRPLAASTALVEVDPGLGTLGERLERHRAEVARLAVTHGPPVLLRGAVGRALVDRVDRVIAQAAFARGGWALAAAVLAGLGVSWTVAGGAWSLFVAAVFAALVAPLPGVMNRLLALVASGVALRAFGGGWWPAWIGVGVAFAVGVTVALLARRAPAYAVPLRPPSELGSRYRAVWSGGVVLLSYVPFLALGVSWWSTGSTDAAMGAVMCAFAPAFWSLFQSSPVTTWPVVLFGGAVWASTVVAHGPWIGGGLLAWTALVPVGLSRVPHADRPGLVELAAPPQAHRTSGTST